LAPASAELAGLIGRAAELELRAGRVSSGCRVWGGESVPLGRTQFGLECGPALVRPPQTESGARLVQTAASKVAPDAQLADRGAAKQRRRAVYT